MEVERDSPIRSNKTTVVSGKECPYLDTINRHVLDFDLPRECSISLSKHNVYACLVCGVYFQGRGINTHAYTHSVQEGHHIFLNFETTKFYCLPDNYEIIDNTLKDVIEALDPKFTKDEIKNIDNNTELSHDQFGSAYLPGYIGMNDLGCSDYMTSVVHALSQVKPLRNFFLDKNNYSYSKSSIVHTFGSLIRRIWNKNNFKNCVGPHEFCTECSIVSKKRFNLGKREDSTLFLTWLLNTLHEGLIEPNNNNTNKSSYKTSIIHKIFQGKIEVTTTTTTASNKMKRKLNQTYDDILNELSKTQTLTVPFMLLTLDVPPIPLFKDRAGSNVIPKVNIMTVLKKYDGETVTINSIEQSQKKYKILTLPNYLIFQIKRFQRNSWTMDKNPTIVEFPIINLDLSENDLFKLPESIQLDEVAKNCPRFNLVSNITHETIAGDTKVKRRKDFDAINEGTYHVHINHQASRQWFEIQDLHVSTADPNLIGCSESHILLYEKILREDLGY